MHEATKHHEKLLRKLVLSFIDYPEELRIKTVEIKSVGTTRPGVFFAMQVHQADFGKTLGKQASHIKALQYLMYELGESIGHDYRLKLEESIKGERMAPWARNKPVSNVDVPSACAFLKSIVLSLFAWPETGTGLTVIPRYTGPSEITLDIDPVTLEGYENLTVAYDDDEFDQTSIAALGTLFRAYGQKEGVRFRLQVLEPKPVPSSGK